MSHARKMKRQKLHQQNQQDVAKTVDVGALRAVTTYKAQAAARAEFARQDMNYQQMIRSGVTKEVVQNYTALTCWILHNTFGFGQKRLTKYLTAMTDLGDSIVRGYLTWDDLAKTLNEETSVNFVNMNGGQKHE